MSFGTSRDALREKVYEAIDGERTYQANKWHEKWHETATYLAFIQHYVTCALAEITKDAKPDAALESVRKIAALAVACMETNGIKFRQPPEE